MILSFVVNTFINSDTCILCLFYYKQEINQIIYLFFRDKKKSRMTYYGCFVIIECMPFILFFFCMPFVPEQRILAYLLL